MVKSLRRDLLPLALVAVLGQSIAVLAHAGAEDDVPPASIANEAPHKAGTESYIQRHMASEHHIGAFDLGSFFALHDLDRNGVLDRAEIEAIYGVHHSESVKHSKDYVVHDEKANRIVREVLFRLDKDHDGLVTLREFVNAGADGLPAFEEYGKGVLGHHYDEESEFYVHHEERFHNTPETQKEETYVHPEDIEHFAHHRAIEAEEERRERKAEGMPSKEEDDRLKKEAALKGVEYKSPYEDQLPKDGSPAAPQHAYDPHAEHGYAYAEGWQSTEHVFKTPEGDHVVHSDPVALDPEMPGAVKAAGKSQHTESAELPQRMAGETDEGYKDRLAAFEKAKAAAAEYAKVNPNLVKAPEGIDPKTGEVKQMVGESLEDYLHRKAQNRFDKTKTVPKFEPANKEQLRKSAPYKYPPIQNRLKKSSFYGEF